MNQKIILGLAALALTLVAVKSFTPAFAYQGDPSVRGPNCTDEMHETMEKAFETGDYQAWFDQMNGRGVTRFVNQDNFKQFAAAHVAAENGDSSLLNSFRTQYGMGRGMMGNGNGQGRGLNR